MWEPRSGTGIESIVPLRWGSVSDLAYVGRLVIGSLQLIFREVGSLFHVGSNQVSPVHEARYVINGRKAAEAHAEGSGLS
jgi:hypothetical protein